MHDLLSIVIITKNSQEQIGDAILSAKFADEVLVVDDYSKDKTVQTAKKLGAKVILNKFKNYSQQKQFAIKQAKNDWIFILDSDEIISKQLASSIYSAIKQNKFSAFKVKRKNYFLGKKVNADFWKKELTIRLFDRKKHKISNRIVHEKILANNNETGFVSGYLLHISHQSIYELSKKAFIYSKPDAEERFKKNPPIITGKNIIFSAIKYFINIYFVGGSYKDGTEGIINSLFMTYQQVILIRSYIWEMQQNPSLKEKNQLLIKHLMKKH